MIYDSRNKKTVATLADNTRKATEKLYAYAKEIGFEILIYEGIRSKAVQEQNVKNGKSQTMKSYHLVGQAFDYVPVDAKGNALWGVGAYTTAKGLQFVKKAKSLGFTWGGDWDNDGSWKDESFLDAPHMQYNYKGYGKDTFGKAPSTAPTVTTTVSKDVVKSIQTTLNKRYGFKLVVDGLAGKDTKKHLIIAMKREFNAHYEKQMGRKINQLDGSFGDTLVNLLPSLKQDSKVPVNLVYILQATLYINNRVEVGTLDGIWGAKTTTAIKNYERQVGFTPDGVIGGKVWRKLLT